MSLSRPVASLALLVCTMFWGFAFVAQKSAMQSMGPLTFTGTRFIIGGLLILPLALYEYRRVARPYTGHELRVVLAMSLVFFAGSILQQIGLLTTSVTNGGFLTSLYIFFVPLIAYLVARVKPHPLVYVSVPLAILGIFWLNGGQIDAFTIGDGYVTMSAVLWACHVLLLGWLVTTTGLPIMTSCISFLVAGVISTVLAFPIDHPTLADLSGGWIELAYAAVCSTAIAFSLQAIGQRFVPPANAALILSAEGLFAALGGALLLGDRLPPIGYVGGALVFFAIVLVEAGPMLMARRRVAA